MAILTDGPTEEAAVTEVKIDLNADVTAAPDLTADSDATERLESDRKEEVPALLGKIALSDNEETEMVSDMDTECLTATDTDGNSTEDGANNTACTTESFQDIPGKLIMPAIVVEPVNVTPEHPAVSAELKKIQESLHNSLLETQYISAKVDAVASDTERLIKEVNSISVRYELLNAEMESISSGANSKSILSKTFLTISSFVLALLVVFQVYMFISLTKIQRLQNTAGSSVLENISSLNKKMGDYDKKLTKALEKPVPPEQVPPNPAAVEKPGHEINGNKDAGTANAAPVFERLNKLRNGLPEKKLIRKETGDWFVFNKKNQECISDADVIEVLNQAYRKIGRPLPPSFPMPSHNAVCILKPNGKGGTEVVMTKDFLP